MSCIPSVIAVNGCLRAVRANTRLRICCDRCKHRLFSRSFEDLDSGLFTPPLPLCASAAVSKHDDPVLPSFVGDRQFGGPEREVTRLSAQRE